VGTPNISETPCSRTAARNVAGSYFGARQTALPPIRVPMRMLEKPTM
jgi:hypothetical protein